MKSLLAALLVLAVFSGTAWAGEGRMSMGMSGERPSVYHEMMQKRHQMMTDMMQMLKTTMGILKGLNHRPSADEQEALGKMMEKLDKMTAWHDEMFRKMQKMHQKMRKEAGHDKRM